MKRSKQIHCPQCKTHIQSEHLDIFSEIAECIECNIKFSLEKDIRNVKEYNILDNTSFANLNQNDLKKYGISLEKSSHGRKINVSGQNKDMAIILTIFTTVLSGFFITFLFVLPNLIRESTNFPQAFIVYFISGLFFMLDICSAYFALGFWINQYIFFISEDELVYYISPFSSKRKKRFIINNIKKIIVELSNLSINGAPTYNLVLHTNTGIKCKLTKWSRKHTKLKILGHLLERLLKIDKRIIRNQEL